MLPLPIENYIPKLLTDNIDDRGQAFIDKINSLIINILDDIMEMQYFKLPERCPSVFIDELGYLLNAGIINTDTDRIKRNKIKNAVRSHRNRGLWQDDAKLRIDNITGYSAKIFRSIDSDDSILMAKQAADPDRYWMTLSAKDGSDDNLGIWLIGDFTEYVIAGNISIDCHDGIHTAVLTAAQIFQIKVEIQDDVVPAYCAVYLGYVNASGQFIVYSGGIIN